MKNLAGNKLAPAFSARELQIAGVEIEPVETAGEVPANLRGRLGAFTFERAWYYWRVNGPMPLETAQALFDGSEIVRKDVRAAGHCGCIRPGEPGASADWIDSAGRKVWRDPDGSQAAAFQEWVDKGLDMGGTPIFSADPAADGHTATIGNYHVDSQDGLNILCDAIRSLCGISSEEERT